MSREYGAEPRADVEPPIGLSGLSAVGYETLADRVYRELRVFLMEGGARPGQKLTLRQLTTSFGTSPMPVRAAVQRLAAEGALDAMPNRAISVPLMTNQRFCEIRRIRIALEGMAVAEATRRATPELIARVEALQVAFVAEWGRQDQDVRNLFRANKDFHFTLYRAAGMPMLEAMIENLWVRVGPVLQVSLGLRAHEVAADIATSHHAEMIRALRRGDADAVRDWLERDITAAGDLILEGRKLPD